ncbi:MAG TPA: hypothetical protein VIK35_12145 [Verrucomicrobiae bacterium]
MNRDDRTANSKSLAPADYQATWLSSCRILCGGKGQHATRKSEVTPVFLA